MTETRKMTYWAAEQAYDEWLDEVYGDVQIGPYEYSTARALRLVDPIAYRTGFSDWLDDMGIEID